MKTKKIVCKLLFIAVFTYSCSDEFLKKGWDVQVLFDTPRINVLPGEDAKEYPIIWADAGNATFNIVSKPDWLKVESMTGQFQNSIAFLSCSAIRNESFTETGIYEATMTIEVEEIGKGIVYVGYVNNGANVNTGNPVFFCEWVEFIDFGRKEDQRSITIFNQGSATLIWKVKECPEWITMEKQDFVLYDRKTITISCNRSVIPDGNHVGYITLTTNDKNRPTYTIAVRCRVGVNNSKNILAIDGWVKDAEYDKKTDILYFVTQSPNKLVAYHTSSKTIIANIELGKEPSCMNIAKDGQTAVVGHDGSLSYIDLITKSVKTVFEMDVDIYDVILNNDNWCYMTNSSLHYINVETGERFIGTDRVSRQTIIKKVPDQSIAIVSSLGLSPSGITIYDMQSKTSVKYFHKNIGRFWFSVDGHYMFDEKMNLYRTPSPTSQNEPQTIGRLQEPVMNGDYYRYHQLYWLDHCAKTNHLWALENDYGGTLHLFPPNTLAQYEANEYTYLKTYYYDYYNTTIDGKTDLYITSAHYVFANSNGSEVYVIKNLADEYAVNAWSMEWIDVK